VRLLLDTHVAVWAVSDPDRLPASLQAMLTDPANEVFVSVVSIWEIAIKRSLLRAAHKPPFSASQALVHFDAAGFQMLDIKAQHSVLVEDLPQHHADPFDRLLVAQSLSEPLRLVSADRQVARYSDTIILI
jgi:PIN domain nuclease of toxin-antitoxin system